MQLPSRPADLIIGTPPYHPIAGSHTKDLGGPWSPNNPHLVPDWGNFSLSLIIERLCRGRTVNEHMTSRNIQA